MKYYAVTQAVLAPYGLGGEPWRKRKGDEVLVSEAEVTGRLGYRSSGDFEDATGAAPMTLREARQWITDNN